MKNNSCIYFVPLSPIFNPEKIPQFESFKIEDSISLYTSLYLNHMELIQNFKENSKIVYAIDQTDREYLPEEFKSLADKTIYVNTKDRQLLWKNIAEKYFISCGHNLIIFPGSIGITPADINTAFNHLRKEDESFVVGRTFNDKTAFVGFNTYNPKMFKEINWDNLTYETLLSSICKYEHFIHVMEYNFMKISSAEDFKKLYQSLSKKESLAYCSHQMHERFTNLFIEYKEMVK
jgi:hypothetical protein